MSTGRRRSSIFSLERLLSSVIDEPSPAAAPLAAAPGGDHFGTSACDGSIPASVGLHAAGRAGSAAGRRRAIAARRRANRSAGGATVHFSCTGREQPPAARIALGVDWALGGGAASAPAGAGVPAGAGAAICTTPLSRGACGGFADAMARRPSSAPTLRGVGSPAGGGIATVSGGSRGPGAQERRARPGSAPAASPSQTSASRQQLQSQASRPQPQPQTPAQQVSERSQLRYAALPEGQTLNRIEAGLFRAGVDVRGQYHRPRSEGELLRRLEVADEISASLMRRQRWKREEILFRASIEANADATTD
eukprot:TRINITY_DN27386_c0_g2_i1.p1 TRINITY_DN27386_c0_g2~~TRINITY_DN27386_c0_g2_i1.p1  ORF type:complete len:308 (+),score=66.17 TRINITY_DN27386_c0_g2_i1:107-1030(+)